MNNSLFLQGVFLTGVLAGIPLLFASIVSLVVSLLQSSLQLQEQTLPYVIRIGTLAGVLYFFGAWGGKEVVKYLQTCLVAIAYLGH